MGVGLQRRKGAVGDVEVVFIECSRCRTHVWLEGVITGIGCGVEGLQEDSARGLRKWVDGGHIRHLDRDSSNFEGAGESWKGHLWGFIGEDIARETEVEGVEKEDYLSGGVGHFAVI